MNSSSVLSIACLVVHYCLLFELQECEKSQEMSTFEMEQNGIGDNSK